jgi:hypothetical protein
MSIRPLLYHIPARRVIKLARPNDPLTITLHVLAYHHTCLSLFESFPILFTVPPIIFVCFFHPTPFSLHVSHFYASRHLCYLRPALVIGWKMFLIKFKKRAFHAFFFEIWCVRLVFSRFCCVFRSYHLVRSFIVCITCQFLFYYVVVSVFVLS